MEMEFEWSDSEAKFLRVFLGKIFKRPYAAAWNTWKDKVESEKAEEEAMKKRKITKRMMKVLERQPQGERDQKGIDDITNWALDVHGDIFTKLNDSELKLACMHMKLRKLKANEVIFLQGWLGLEYIIIVSGRHAIRSWIWNFRWPSVAAQSSSGPIAVSQDDDKGPKERCHQL